MEFRIFQYPLPCESQPEDLNQCLSNHRVASVKQYLSETDGTPMLIFVVQLTGSDSNNLSSKKERIDYRKILSADDYEVFNDLRDIRKNLAEQEGLPVYSIFTNAQLAAMVNSRPKNSEELIKLDGISTAKAEKYGESFIHTFTKQIGPKNES